MSKPIQTAVVGVGMASTVFHVPLVLSLPDLFTLRWVVERNPLDGQQGGTIGQKFKVSVNVVKSLHELLGDPEVELVIIATPNSTHYPFAKAALEAGKHVLVDKPVTTTYEDALDLLAIAKSRNLILSGFQNRRWDSDFLTVRKLLSDQPSLGNITEFLSHYDRYRTNLKENWRERYEPGAGLAFDLGAHLIDQALVLFGRPAQITAFIENLRGVGDERVDDSFTIIFHYPRSERNRYPIKAVLRSHPLSQRTPQLRYTVRGDKGTFTKFGLDTQEEDLKEGDLSLLSTPHFGVEPQAIWGELQILEGSNPVKKTVQSEVGAYKQLYRNLAGSIRQGEALAVKWEEAAAVILMIELSIKSSQEGRTIDVPQS